MSDVALDPRWEWVEVGTLDGRRWTRRGACLHTEVIAVESTTGEVVAQLCMTCDRQFPAPKEETP